MASDEVTVIAEFVGWVIAKVIEVGGVVVISVLVARAMGVKI